MYKKIIAIVILLTLSVNAASLTIEAQAEKENYRVGQTVSWSVRLGASSSDNMGVSFVSINIEETGGALLNLPIMDGSDFDDSELDSSNSFMDYAGGKSGNSIVRQIYATQYPDKTLNIANDGDLHNFVHGTYVVNEIGENGLLVTCNLAFFFPDADSSAVPFASGDITINNLEFGVYHPADINYDDSIDIDDLEILSQQWLSEGEGLQADISPADGDGIVDLDDFALLASYWLYSVDIVR